MDQNAWDARTDVLVVVRPEARSLTWIPRDLWVARLANRVNEAYASGGTPLLIEALGDLGYPVDHCICLLPSAVSRGVGDLEIVVPVEEEMRFWYPLEPQRRIEDGKKLVQFDPPEERLSGERFHHWIGARFPAGEKRHPRPDLHRIARQQVLVRRLLEETIDFGRFLDGEHVRVSSPDALAELRGVRADWTYARHERFHAATIDGHMVLVPD